MKAQDIRIGIWVLMAFSGGATFAQSDSVVLNQTDFRFPETHPGEVFTVKKMLVARKGGFGKGSSPGFATGEGAVPATSSQATVPFAKRDLRGRLTRNSEYQARLARIQKRQGLPTMAGRTQESGRPFRSPQRFEIPEGARQVLTSNSPLIQSPQDLARMERAEHQALRRRYGALFPKFAQKLEALKETDSVDISIELAIDAPGFINGMTASLEERKANAKAWARAKPFLRGEDLMRQYGLRSLDKRNGAPNSHSLTVRTTRAKVLALARVPGIVSIAERPVLKTATVPGSGPQDYQALINSAYNPPEDMEEFVGVSAATMEFGLTPDYVNCLSSDLRPVQYDPWNTATLWWGNVPAPDDHSAHSEGTYHLLALGTPGNDRYHFNNDRYSLIMDSLINHNIISISSSEVAYWYDPTADESRVIDRFAYIYPYPVFSMPTSNGGHGLVPSNLMYNALIVGNVQHYDNAHYTVDFQHVEGSPATLQYINSSQSKNPTGEFNSADDWELPSLVAPGLTADPWWGLYNSCIYSGVGTHWGPGGGTSFSSPVAAAMATDVLAARNNYSEPRQATEARAIMLATAQNVDSGYWDPHNQDSRDGAGTVSGARATEFAWSVPNNVFPEDQGYISAIGSQYVDSAVMSGSMEPIQYSYLVPSELPEGKHLRVLLTWTSSPGTTVSENEVSDFELDVETGSGWFSSDTWNGNVEMLDINSYDLQPDQTYHILLRPWTYRQAQDGPNLLYYTVAWTWVKDHAD